MIYGSEKNKLQKKVFIRFQFCKTRTKIIPYICVKKEQGREERSEGKSGGKKMNKDFSGGPVAKTALPMWGD